jgi:hypothetical protein
VVTEVEGSAGLGKRNFFTTAPTNDLDVLALFVVDDLIEAAVLTDTSEFFERGFMVESGQFFGLAWIKPPQSIRLRQRS